MKVVVGVDGSKNSLAAVKVAGRLLDPQKDTIVLYYSLPTVALESLRPHSADVYMRAREAFARAVFRDAQAALPDEFRQACLTVHDKQKPHKGILTTAHAHSAGMVVIGARGTGRIQRLLLGSVSRAVAHACELPTLVVRNVAEDAADRPLRLLIGCSGAEGDASISALLHKLSWPGGSQARVVHVIESLFAGEIPEWLLDQARSQEVELQAQAWVLQHEQDKERAKQQMQAYCQSLPEALKPLDVVVAEGNPAQEILECLEQEPYDLAVLGTHGYGAVMRVLLGSTSEHILAHAHTSVLIVPQLEKS